MIISGGLGESVLPLRFNLRPEIGVKQATFHVIVHEFCLFLHYSFYFFLHRKMVKHVEYYLYSIETISNSLNLGTKQVVLLES